MSLIAKYPFIVDFEKFLAKEARISDPLPEIVNDPDLIDLATKRIESLLRGNLRESFLSRLDSFGAVTSFYLGLAIAGKASRTLLALVISKEISEASKMLSGESEEVTLHIASMLGVKVKKGQARVPWIITSEGKTVERVLPYTLDLKDYLEILGRSARSETLANSFILDGKVFLDSSGLKRLVIAKARWKIENEAKKLSSLESAHLSRAAKTLLGEFGSAAEAPPSAAVAGLIHEALPECIKSIIEKGLSGADISDQEFFLLLSFLANIRAPPKLLSEVFSKQLGLSRDAALDLSIKALKIASDFKPYDCSKPPGREVCSDCPGDLVRYYLEKVKTVRGKPRRAQGS
ncbi:MAG: hypothetical protein F7C07_00585 [Desulfurococcales archaeon]|nr:hypothetical protein [Desulfurococcales archaeon]